MELKEKSAGKTMPLLQENGKGNAEKILIEIEHPKLSVFQTCSIVISSVGGVGLFVAMSTMMVTTGSVGVLLIIVLVSGLLNFSLAKCFAEVAIILPKAGGPYFFLLQVFGELPAFLFLWGFIFMIITPSWAYLAYASSLYIVQLFFPGCRPPDSATKLLGACILGE
jgi:amino acid transporter